MASVTVSTDYVLQFDAPTIQSLIAGLVALVAAGVSPKTIITNIPDMLTLSITDPTLSSSLTTTLVNAMTQYPANVVKAQGKF